MKSRAAFTLLEILTTVAIIGLLLAILVPSVRYGLRYSRASSDAATLRAIVQDVRTMRDLPGFYGGLPITSTVGSVPVTGTMAGASTATIEDAATVDLCLYAYGLIQEPYRLSLGSNPGSATVPLRFNTGTNRFYTTGDVAPVNPSRAAKNRLETIASNPALAPSVALGANFQISPNINLPAGTTVCYVIMPQIPEADARALVSAVKTTETFAVTGAAQNTGTVVYAAPSATTGLTDVYIYIAHL